MLKPEKHRCLLICRTQPPSGGCVLKQTFVLRLNKNLYQPPSGGCVLKRIRGFILLPPY